MIDVVIPAHIKDIDTLNVCIDGAKKSVKGLKNVYVISKDKLTEEAEWIPESCFPFSLNDVSSIIGKHWRTCWYYQQLLKFYASFVNDDLCDTLLLMDSDTVFLNEIDFIDGDIAYFNVGTENYLPYFEHMNKLIPGLSRMTSHSGITHHMVFQRDILNSMFKEVEENHGCSFWEAFLNCTLGKFNTVIGEQSHEGQGRASEYEIYFNYCIQRCPERMKIRKLNSILSYKDELGCEKEIYEGYSSRTNDNRQVNILNEKVPDFNNIQESFLYAINKCREVGFDSVTFQKHQRQGMDGYKQDSENYIMEVCDDTNR